MLPEHFLRRSLPLAVVLCAVGCSSAPPAPPYDSKQAQEVLVVALDAWKQGRIETLAKRDPPVRFEDEDCRSGLRLIEYRLGRSELPDGPFDNVPVTLCFRDREGKRVEKAVTYQVALGPRPAVLRND